MLFISDWYFVHLLVMDCFGVFLHIWSSVIIRSHLKKQLKLRIIDKKIQQIRKRTYFRSLRFLYPSKQWHSSSKSFHSFWAYIIYRPYNRVNLCMYTLYVNVGIFCARSKPKLKFICHLSIFNTHLLLKYILPDSTWHYS